MESGGYPLFAVCGRLIVVPSRVAEHMLQALQAQYLWLTGLVALPHEASFGSGMEPVSPNCKADS